MEPYTINFEPVLSTLSSDVNFWLYLMICCLSIFQVDHSVVERSLYFSIPQPLHNLHKQTETFSLTSSYGLFRM